MSTPGPGKGKKKRRGKGRGAQGRGRGRGQDLPTPGRLEGSGRPVDEEDVEVESEEKPATGARSDPERPSSSTTADYDELPETGRERPKETETTANEKVGEGVCVASTKVKTSSSSTTVDQQQEPGCSVPRAKNKSKWKQQQVPGPSKSSPSSGTKVKESPSVAATNTTASAVPSTVTAAASAAAEATSGPPTATSAGVPTTTAADKQDVEKLTRKLGCTLTTNAHQTQGNGGPRPPKRPDYGTVGRPIRLIANFFRLNISSQLSDLYHYDVEITPVKCSQTGKKNVRRAVKRDVVNQIIKRYKDTTFQGHRPAFDGEKNLYSRIELKTPDEHNFKLPDEDGGKDYRKFKAELSVKLPGEDGGKDREFKVKIQDAGTVSLLELRNFLGGKQNGKVPQDAVQALDIVVREMPSLYYMPVGRSFFPFDCQGRPLGEGCEVRFGFYSSVRHSEWKAMLVNIDVSAKGFFKEQPVIDFICETHGRGVTPQSLENRNFRFEKHRFKEAINGARIQTTHAAYKRKYTVRGVSSFPAEKLEFEVEDGATGRKSKTTVAEYFRTAYKLRLRYPHLPCLQCGEKKVRYLPMEVCTIIPGPKKHLTEEQTANMIRSTARPAPERQQAIQKWAQEMIQTNSKYLREEFQTSVSPEMVKVDGRVLPAPKIKLGPRDQALVPKDGSWDMRNRMLHEGACINTWALACFASRCSEGELRNFCKQMASVSTREGMRMTEQPTAVEYPRDVGDVESLFSKWAVDFPQLQLIMAVLPDKEKELYPEIKRVGDNVLGIATQCVQIKRVKEAKPQVCANLSLKINSKLGGINHVIDPSEKSPVFREPVIIFGADVTHPSPTENGIPSIAAVVASMDKDATKYCARVRAQTHHKSGGAQEIINDLAAMVKELLIEFYKANRGLKPLKIIFYRDGVSEGQFDQVLVHEVRAVQEACMKLEKEYRPRITFVVVQKRHHTRLFCEDRRDASGKAQNVPPGTTVDTGITHPYEFDFYLCSHYGIQGTSRPTHYHVLYDDNGFTADSLQQLTYQLCHVYARCTRSVSMPAPAYYAHLVAFRARHHVTNGRGGDLESSAKAIQVSDRMKGAMYFT